MIFYNYFLFYLIIFVFYRLDCQRLPTGKTSLQYQHFPTSVYVRIYSSRIFSSRILVELPIPTKAQVMNKGGKSDVSVSQVLSLSLQSSCTFFSLDQIAQEDYKLELGTWDTDMSKCECVRTPNSNGRTNKISLQLPPLVARQHFIRMLRAIRVQQP